MTATNEQYRAGFEAWLGLNDRIGPHANWDGEGYDDNTVNQMFEAWTASKREASTEPSAMVESLRAALRSVNAVAIERGDKYGACDQIDNDGQPYQSAWFAKLLAGQSAGALTDDAADAARLDFIDAWVERCKAAGMAWATFTLDTKSTGREQIDAEIEAHTKAGSGTNLDKDEK